MRRLFVAGNWKMNTTRQTAAALAGALAADFPAAGPVEIAICPPFPYLITVREAVSGSGIALGAQNAWHAKPGAFTGEVSLEMLQDLGCDWVILGHSERRSVLHESDELINAKINSALDAGLGVIFCIGEQLEDRRADKTEQVLTTQLNGGLAGIDGGRLAGLVIAYEPVWAIGTGVTAEPGQAEAAHDCVRQWLTNRYNTALASEMRILYGGSVKPNNADELLAQPNVDGALVGGASLEAASFAAIVNSANRIVSA